MIDTERHYSQIEKEALALVWAYEKFQHNILGKYINFETDHKLLGHLMSTTSLDSLPPRVLWFRLRLMRFSCSICHIAGKYFYTADTLSCASVSHPDAADVLEDHLTECFVTMC